jgi:hypothetical protein
MARLQDVVVHIGAVEDVVDRLKARWAFMSRAERSLAADRLLDETRLVAGPGALEFTLVPPEGL